jgi:hypothetical protein
MVLAPAQTAKNGKRNALSTFSHRSVWNLSETIGKQNPVLRLQLQLRLKTVNFLHFPALMAIY